MATRDRTTTVSGRFDAGAPDWVYLPVEVPAGVREIAVSYSYDQPTPAPGDPGNALDIGIFDESGHDPGNARGFRGWSGGARDRFSISASAATPGYLPGPVRAGTWHLILGPYTVHPLGMEWTVDVTLRFGSPGPAFMPAPAPPRATGRGRDWYRGDMHLHTVHSDGQWRPEQLVASARAAGLDFIVSTEHNTSSASGVWGHHASDDLLIVDGEEVSTRNGHFVAAGLPAGTWIDWRYRATDGAIAGFLRDIHRDGGIAIAAHPYCRFVGCRWKFGYDGIDAVEVWNGPWTPDDELSVATWDSMLVGSLRSGQGWIPAVGNSDAHNPDHTVGLPQTVVFAEDLERGAIQDGIRAGRSWIAESAAVQLEFTAAGGRGLHAGIGRRLATKPDEPVTVRLDVSGVPGGFVRLITDEGQMVTQSLPASGTGTVTWRTTAAIAAYVRAEVRKTPTDPTTGLPGPMAALTNPIFLGAR
jgi:hypothetical protein